MTKKFLLLFGINIFFISSVFSFEKKVWDPDFSYEQGLYELANQSQVVIESLQIYPPKKTRYFYQIKIKGRGHYYELMEFIESCQKKGAFISAATRIKSTRQALNFHLVFNWTGDSRDEQATPFFK